MKILPVYQRLASDDLLVRFVSDKTQNANENLRSIIWKNCSKETFVSKDGTSQLSPPLVSLILGV